MCVCFFFVCVCVCIHVSDVARDRGSLPKPLLRASEADVGREQATTAWDPRMKVASRS